MKTLNNTPIEKYDHEGWEYFVKREDLCTQPPGPPFSKIRGLMPVLEDLKERGIKYVGYTETSISMAGWGVAWGCKQLGLTAVIYNPIYKKTPPVLAYHRERWKEAGAVIVDIPAGMAKVNFHIYSKVHKEKYKSKGIMLPLGLPFPATVRMTANEIHPKISEMDKPFESVVTCIGSGTVAAGILRGFRQGPQMYGIMTRSGNVEKKKQLIERKSNVMIGGMIGADMRVIDPGWEYTERSNWECPFPCHPYYDLKAYQWMITNKKKLKQPVLFWNIGSMPEGIE